MAKDNKNKIDFAKLELNYEGFRDLARNNNLSCYEKIGFPNSYRKGYEKDIFEDILTKLTNINKNNQVLLDIGPGCTDLPKSLIDISQKNNHQLVFCDSEEMLEFHEARPFLHKVPGMFPKNINEVKQIKDQYDVILCYSVFHYIYVDTNIWSFLDSCLSLLKPEGQFLIGDIPNNSKRKRFFASENGIKYHQNFTNTEEIPLVEYNKIEEGKIDDAVLHSILLRAQASGFDAYLMPQNNKLPMKNRRDDILITRP